MPATAMNRQAIAAGLRKFRRPVAWFPPDNLFMIYGVTVTFSKVVVQTVPSLWLVTARPMETFALIKIVCDPIVVQLEPSAER